ncbi:MAG: AI-2E family transporter [Opitutae bacterium]|nr:AI-2E family transporter [Opitutae bacterium]
MSDPYSPQPLLSPYQRKVVASAITGLSLLLLFLLVIGIILVAGKLLGIFSTVIWPLATATILTLLLKPVVTTLQRITRLNRLISIILLYLLVILLLLSTALLVLPSLVLQAIALFESFPPIFEKLIALLNERAPGWLSYLQDNLNADNLNKFGQQMGEVFRNLLAGSGGALKVFGQGLAGFLSWTVAVAIIPVYLFFFLQFDHAVIPRLRSLLPFLKREHQDDALFLAGEFADIMVAFFRGQFLISLIMGILLGTGFSLCGLSSGFFIGMILGLLNLIPYLGTILGVATTLPLAFFQTDGGWSLTLAVLAVMVLVQVIEGWVLTPNIMGSKTGLHPAVIIFSVFFWGIALNGLLGMVLAIPLSAFFVTFWRLVERKYLPLFPDREDSPRRI